VQLVVFAQAREDGVLEVEIGHRGNLNSKKLSPRKGDLFSGLGLSLG
jgi:hypothetical protein